jgi:hypothetical protein
MKHVTFGEKSLLMSDDAADSLIDYARLLAIASSADTVTVRAIGADGNTVDAAFLLNHSTVLVVESTNSTVVPPPNDEAVRYMRERMDRLTNPRSAPSDDPDDILHLEDFDIPGAE